MRSRPEGVARAGAMRPSKERDFLEGSVSPPPASNEERINVSLCATVLPRVRSRATFSEPLTSRPGDDRGPRRGMATPALRTEEPSVVAQRHLENHIAASVARAGRNVLVRSAPEITFGAFRKDGFVRHRILRFIMSPLADAGLATLVVLNAIAMGFFDPLEPPNSRRNSAVTAVTLSINTIFAFELLMRMVAFGTWGRGSYFVGRSGWPSAWNCLDAALVVLGFGAASPRVGQIAALRLLRLLRWAYARVPRSE